jgi:hypothetical protein
VAERARSDLAIAEPRSKWKGVAKRNNITQSSPTPFLCVKNP